MSQQIHDNFYQQSPAHCAAIVSEGLAQGPYTVTVLEEEEA